MMSSEIIKYHLRKNKTDRCAVAVIIFQTSLAELINI